MWRSLKKAIFSMPYREISWDYRGFGPCDPHVKVRVEAYFTAFLDGYHMAIVAEDYDALGASLDRTIEPELIGFAYEGAGMYFALLDFLTPWQRDRVETFISGAARAHDIITQIGIGLIFSRLPWVKRNVDGALKRLDPGVGWFAVDGYGFHEGFFHHQRFLLERTPPRRLDGYAARCFDHGLGRSLWFVSGADPDRIHEIIEAFPVARRADLWAGMGLACAFAGGVHSDLGTYQAVIEKLAGHARPYQRELKLGIVFAADTRVKSKSLSPWTAKACELVLGMDLEAAGKLAAVTLDATRDAFRDKPAEEVRNYGYEQARQSIMAAVELKAVS